MESDNHRLRLGLDVGGGARLGPGRADPLEAIASAGSISAAARVPALCRPIELRAAEAAAAGVGELAAMLDDMSRRKWRLRERRRAGDRGAEVSVSGGSRR